MQEEDRTGCTRDMFKHWIDADKDSCNTRAEALKAEAVIAPAQGANCTLTGGEWYSPYDDQYIQRSRGLDIDHLVPLAEAWDSRASAWTAKEREAYANDFGCPPLHDLREADTGGSAPSGALGGSLAARVHQSRTCSGSGPR